MNREELIEEAAETMHDAYEEAADREGWETQERSRKPWSEVPEANKRTMLVAVEAALAVFEKAQAPTGEEREALSNFLFSVYEHGSQPNALREADAILSFLASRRTAQTEPEYEYTSANYDGTPNNQSFYVYGSVPARIAKYRRVKAGDWEPVPNQSDGDL